MRIVIDMQGAQSSGSRNRGIGRYSLALAEAMVRNRQEHEIVLALSGLFPETIEPIREAFSGLLPPENIRVWHAPTPVNFSEPSNLARRRDAQSIYEAFLHELGPDIVHITNIFEGLVDDAVTCVPTGSDRYLVGITLYDLIPHLYPDPYLLNPVVNEWYREKIAHLRSADLWLAISDSSKEEGIRYLNLPRDRCHNISTDVDPKFCQASLSSAHEESIRQKYGLTRNFVMYTGGIDHRKNIEGLIRAFGNLPPLTRQNHQLAVVCAVNAQDQKRLQQLAAAAGLASDQLVMTGFIPDNDLFSLYNLCALFVFPSWHEGFGLPALEAMRCGAPTIGSNASSLPEVIGWSEALFDPRSDQDMTRVMLKGLTDEKFRSELKDRQAKHATLFSWDESARRAIAAMSAVWTNKVHHHTIAISELQVKRKRMAYVSPLPAARSGVADYSAELLPALAKYYDIEVVACQDEPIEAPWINENLKVRTVKWFVEHAADYDRILYHCGNSSYHQHIFDLIDRFPGTVVLHDFFLSSIQAHREISGASAGAWIESLYNSHGYHAVHARLSANDVADTVWHYPANLSILQRATGVIVHSAHSANLARYWYGPNAADDWSIIPLLRVPAKSIERSEARLRLGIPLDELLICSFGVLGRTKLNDRLINTWISSPLSAHHNARLVFVGQNDGGDYGQGLVKKIKNIPNGGRVHITGWTTAEQFRDYLAAADIAVQLRTLSRGEASAAVLDCMNYGLPTIVNAHGSMADLDEHSVVLIPDDFTDKELGDALMGLATNSERRNLLGRRAKQIIQYDHAPELCGRLYAESIEKAYANHNSRLTGLVKRLGRSARSEADILHLSACLGESFPAKPRMRQLMVDVSELARHDAKTGIQRAVRNLLRAWLAAPPPGFRIEPVYSTNPKYGYLYARDFTSRFLGFSTSMLKDEPIDYAAGDIFFGLDMHPDLQASSIDFYQRLRMQGVVVKFMVYDLLCIRIPRYFELIDTENFSRWLNAVSVTDGAVCISKSVATDLKNWIQENKPARRDQFSIDWAHLGADVNETCSAGASVEASTKDMSWLSPKCFLMVGTLEPRKGHSEVLDAFETLWKRGCDFHLLIIGKQGWMVGDLSQRLEKHPELNRRMHWLKTADDDQLNFAYSQCACLIVASHGEGFGLPIIEAAQHNLPIIARDLPVFREVAGDHAFYFTATQPHELANSIESWIGLYTINQHPRSENIPWLTWKQSAEEVLKALKIQTPSSMQQ